MTEIEALLKQHGGELIRQRKHHVYSIHGKRFVMSSTPSDRRSAQNELATLRRLLGSDRQEM